jgi:hypothetical protein
MNESGMPIQSIRISRLIKAFRRLNGGLPIFDRGTTARFMTAHTKHP